MGELKLDLTIHSGAPPISIFQRGDVWRKWAKIKVEQLLAQHSHKLYTFRKHDDHESFTSRMFLPFKYMPNKSLVHLRISDLHVPEMGARFCPLPSLESLPAQTVKPHPLIRASWPSLRSLAFDDSPTVAHVEATSLVLDSLIIIIDNRSRGDFIHMHNIQELTFKGYITTQTVVVALQPLPSLQRLHLVICEPWFPPKRRERSHGLMFPPHYPPIPQNGVDDAGF